MSKGHKPSEVAVAWKGRLFGGNGGRTSHTGAECAESPTGSHWWLIETPSGPTSKGVCRHCGAERDFSNRTVPDWGRTGGEIPILLADVDEELCLLVGDLQGSYRGLVGEL